MGYVSHLIGCLLAAPDRGTRMRLGGGAGPAVFTTPASMVKIYPDWLDWLDPFAPGNTCTGLGQSAPSNHPSLVKACRFDTLNATLRVDTALAQHLWRNAETTPD